MNYLSTYVVALLAYASFGLVNLMASARGFAPPDLMEHFIMLAFGLLVAVPIHEAGHGLAGAAQGYCPVRFVFGPLEVSRVENGWRVRIIAFRRAAMIYQVPSSFTNFRLQQATCLAAGPCLSLIACLLFISIGIRQVNGTSFWFWMVNAQMCLLASMELVPMRFRQFESDGIQLWSLYRGGEELDALQRDVLADCVNYTELRPRDWPAELMSRIGSMEGDEPQRQYCSYLAYIHYRDAGDAGMAWLGLKGVLDLWEPGDAAHYALEGAYFLAFHRHDLEGAREWLARESRYDGKPIRLRAEAAIAVAERRPQDARRLIEEAEAQLRDARPGGNRDFELASLLAMREEIGVDSPASPGTLASVASDLVPTTLATAGN